MWLKTVTDLLVALTIGLIPYAPSASGKEYQDSKDDYPDFYRTYPLIALDMKSGAPQVRFLRYEKSGDTTITRFDTQAVPAGKELAIRGYWISKNLIEAYRAKYNKEKGTLYKGADYPVYDDILNGFRAPDEQALSEMIGKLSELRRTPESASEARKVQDKLDPKLQQDVSDFYTQMAFGTGMIEVEDLSAKGRDATKRRFIPLSLLQTGNISIQPEKGRIQILKSVVMNVVSESLLEDHREIESELNRTLARIECAHSPCIIQATAFSQVVEAVLKTGLVDNATRIDIMDPRYDEKLSRAETAKLKKVASELRKLCLP